MRLRPFMFALLPAALTGLIVGCGKKPDAVEPVPKTAPTAKSSKPTTTAADVVPTVNPSMNLTASARELRDSSRQRRCELAIIFFLKA